MSPDLAAYRFRHAVDVRFRDVDAMGHVHHSLALVYFEEARAAYWRDVAGQPGLDDIGYILAEVGVRYHARIRYPSRPLVGVRTSRLGTRSFTMEYALWLPSGTPGAEDLLASGHTVQVMFDYAAGESCVIPDDVRGRIREYERDAGVAPAGG